MLQLTWTASTTSLVHGHVPCLPQIINNIWQHLCREIDEHPFIKQRAHLHLSISLKGIQYKLPVTTQRFVHVAKGCPILSKAGKSRHCDFCLTFFSVWEGCNPPPPSLQQTRHTSSQHGCDIPARQVSRNSQHQHTGTWLQNGPVPYHPAYRAFQSLGSPGTVRQNVSVRSACRILLGTLKRA